MSKASSTFDQKLLTYKQPVSQYLSSIITKEKPQSLYEPMKYVLSGGGKQLRPVLMLLTANAFGGAVERMIPAAGAIEILHNFTLVHDDIMDNDATRRGRPTVHHKWGIDVALLAGDGLVALAYESLARTQTDRLIDVHRMFTECILELCEGQALDKEFEVSEDVSMEAYLEMIRKKTGRLLGLCTEMGCALSGGSKTDMVALRGFGESLGIAFQIQDDLLDITSEEKVLGKDFGSDIKRKKKTFLLIHALEHGTEAQRAEIRKEMQSEQISRDGIYRIRQHFEEIGSIQCALTTVQEYIDTAEAHLDSLHRDISTGDLKNFLRYILKRKF